jgi:peroxiredoxin
MVLADSEMTAAKALGIAFHLDGATVKKYKTDYGIDIEADSGQKHHLLPVPAAFVIGRDGVVHFWYVNPNYKVRVDAAVLRDAAKAALRQSSAGNAQRRTATAFKRPTKGADDASR